MKKIITTLILVILLVSQGFTQDPTIPVRGKIKFFNSTSDIPGVLVNTGDGTSEFQYFEFIQINDTCFTSSFSQDTICFPSGGGSSNWESYLSGIRPVNNSPTFLPDLLVEYCDLYEMPDTVSTALADSILGTAAVGFYFNAFDVATISNNEIGVLDAIDSNSLEVAFDSTSRGTFSILIDLINQDCYPEDATGIDSIKFTVVADVEPLNIDTTNAVAMFISQPNAYVYPRTDGELVAFVNGNDTTEFMINGNNIDFDGGLAMSTEWQQLSNFNVSFISSDIFTIDAILVEIYFNLAAYDTFGVVGYNSTTGRLIPLDINDFMADSEPIISATYQTLVDAINGDSLIYPATYLITDHATSWKYQYTDVVGDGSGGSEEEGLATVEPLLVKTISSNQVDEGTVKSLIYPQDEIYWTPEVQNIDDYPSTAMGIIYHRHDIARNISLNFDWRNIKQYRWNNGSDVYNITKKVNAPNPADKIAFFPITPFAKDVVIERRGTPDNTSTYNNSNIVIKKAGTFPAYIITSTGNSTATYDTTFILPYDHVQYWSKAGDDITSSALPFGTTIDSVINHVIYLSAAAVSTGGFGALISTDGAFVAVNRMVSATNLTVEDAFYDNRIHIVLESSFEDMYLNDGLSVSLSNFTEYSHNNVNELVLCEGTVFTKNSGTDLFGVTFTDTVRHHTFLSNITSETINSTAYMKSTSSSSHLFGEIHGMNEPLWFTDYSSLKLDLPSNGIGKVLTDVDGNGTAEWQTPSGVDSVSSNIYTENGALTGDREFSGAGFNLSMIDFNDVTISAASGGLNLQSAADATFNLYNDLSIIADSSIYIYSNSGNAYGTFLNGNTYLTNDFSTLQNGKYDVGGGNLIPVSGMTASGYGINFLAGLLDLSPFMLDSLRGQFGYARSGTQFTGLQVVPSSDDVLLSAYGELGLSLDGSEKFTLTNAGIEVGGAAYILPYSDGINWQTLVTNGSGSVAWITIPTLYNSNGALEGHRTVDCDSYDLDFVDANQVDIQANFNTRIFQNIDSASIEVGDMGAIDGINIKTQGPTQYIRIVPNGDDGDVGDVLTAGANGVEWSAPDVFTTLVDAATIAWDLENVLSSAVTLTASRTLDTPSNAINGKTYKLMVVQDGTGGWSLSYHADYLFPTSGGSISTAANDISMLECIYYNGKMHCTIEADFD